MSDRQQKMEGLIQELIAAFVLTEANPNPLITITRVTTDEKTRKATVFFTTIPEDREQDALIFLKRFAGEIRHFILKKGRLRNVPHLEFSIDGEERDRQHKVDETEE